MKTNRRISARVAPLLGVLALAAVAGGCNLTRPPPTKNVFLLDPRVPAPAVAAKPVTLRIGAVNVAAPYRDRTFVYRTGELQFETDFYHEFLVAPSSMIANATARALEGSRVFARVVPSGSAPEDGDFVLEAFVSDLYADARKKPPAAVLAITFFVTRTAFLSSVVWSRAYAERVDLDRSTPEALASAWNEALSRVLETLARDLAAAKLSPG